MINIDQIINEEYREIKEDLEKRITKGIQEAVKKEAVIIKERINKSVKN